MLWYEVGTCVKSTLSTSNNPTCCIKSERQSNVLKLSFSDFLFFVFLFYFTFKLKIRFVFNPCDFERFSIIIILWHRQHSIQAYLDLDVHMFIIHCSWVRGPEFDGSWWWLVFSFDQYQYFPLFIFIILRK